MSVSKIGSRSTSARIADQTASVMKCPSWSCGWYRACTSLQPLSLPSVMTIARLIICKRLFRRSFNSLLAQKAAAEKMSLLRSQQTEICQLSVNGENYFYDPKLILKHIIWIHFMMHSFIPSDTCVECSDGREPRTRAQGSVVLCCSYAANVFGI